MKTPQPPAEEAQTKIENRSGLIDESVIARYIDMLGDDDLDRRLRQYQRASGRVRMGETNQREGGG